MAELQVLLQSNGAFKSELLQSFLSSSRGSSSSSQPSTIGTSATPITSLTPPDVNLNVDPQFANSNLNSNLMPQNLNGNTAFTSQTGNVNESSTLIMSQSLDNSGNLMTGATTTSTTTTGNINDAVKKMDNLNMNSPPVTTSSQTEATQIKSDPFADLPSNEEFVSKVLNEVKQIPSETGTILITQVSNAVYEAHVETTINTHANVAEANERIRTQATPPEMPDMSKMASNPSAMWQHFMSSMKAEIAKVVKFCKKLPGFPEISPKDQMLLIKQGTFEVMITRICVIIDHVNEEMFDPSLKMKSPRHVVKQLPTGAFVDTFFDVAKLFNPLELTDGEIGVFTAILMLCPDRQGLTDTSTIATIQLLYLQALYSLLKKSHQDADSTFSKLVGLIPMFQRINENHLKFINAMKMKMPTEYNSQFPSLHKDVFGEDQPSSS